MVQGGAIEPTERIQETEGTELARRGERVRSSAQFYHSTIYGKIKWKVLNGIGNWEEKKLNNSELLECST